MNLAECKLSDNFDKKKISDTIIAILDQHAEDNHYILYFTNKILHGNQIGQILLKSPDFKNKIEKIRHKASLAIQKEEFIKKIKAGSIESARSAIKGASKEDILPNLENPFMKHIADILLDEKPDFNKRNSDGKTLLYLILEADLSTDTRVSFIKKFNNKENILHLYDEFKKCLEQHNIPELKKIARCIYMITHAYDEYERRYLPIPPYFPEEFLNLFINAISEKEPNLKQLYAFGTSSLLHMLIEKDVDPKLLEAILKLDIDPNIECREGSPLHKAIRNKNIPAIKTLLDAGADLFKYSYGWGSPFAYAVSHYSKDELKLGKWLFEKYVTQFPDVYAQDLDKFEKDILRQFEWMIRNDLDFLDIVLSKIKIQSNEIIKSQLNNIVIRLLNKTDFETYYNNSLILKLVRLTNEQYQVNPDMDHAKTVDTIIDYLKKPTDQYSKLYVIEAIMSGKSAIGEALLKSKEGDRLRIALELVQTHILNQKNLDEFISCLKRGLFDEAKKRLSHVPKNMLAEIKSPLIQHLITILQDEKPNFHLVDDKGRTLLHLLALEDALYPDPSEAILRYNINPNIEDREGNGALFYALDKCNWKQASQLIALKTEFQAEKKYNQDVLDKATDSYSHNELIPWMIKHNFKYTNEFVKTKSHAIESKFYHLINHSPIEKLPEAFEAIELMVKNHNTPEIQQNLLQAVHNLFNDCIEDENRIDVNKLQQFLKLEFKVATDLDIDLSDIRYKLLLLTESPEYIKSDEDRMKIINTILDPTSYFGRQLLKSKSTMSHFESTSTSKSSKFRDKLVAARNKILEKKQASINKDKR